MKYISPPIYIYLQSVQAYIAPPIAACFLLGVLYPRLNGTGALAALWTGLVIGTARLVLELARSDLALRPQLCRFCSVHVPRPQHCVDGAYPDSASVHSS